MTPKFLYVSDELRSEPPFVTSEPPTAEDLEQAKVKMTTLIRLFDMHYYTPSGWMPIKPGVLVEVDETGTTIHAAHN